MDIVRNSNKKIKTTQIEKSNINNELPEEILMEVLARLPAKSIARFKCVSKNWLALFTSNLTFRELYKACAYARKGGVLHVIPPSSYQHNPPYGRWDRRIFVIDTYKPPDVRGSVIDLSSLPFDVSMRTNIIDGLICFYNKFGSIYLCNIFTREIIGLPPPKEMYETRRCIIGYDPNNKVYKVVRVFTAKRRLNGVECEVFTMINNNNTQKWIQSKNRSCWRSIDISYIDVDYLWRSQSDDDGFYLNGVVYWTSQYYEKQGVILLDVEKETLQVIKCPIELFYVVDGTLAYIQGHLSLVMINRLHCSETDTCRIEITWWKIVHGEDMESPLLTSTIFDCPFPRSCLRFRWSCGRRCFCNHVGQLFSIRWVIEDKCIVDCYDINTGKYKELHVNNAQGMLLRPFYNFNPTLVVENIISFTN